MDASEYVAVAVRDVAAPTCSDAPAHRFVQAADVVARCWVSQPRSRCTPPLVVGPVPVQAAGVQVTVFCQDADVVSVDAMAGTAAAVYAPAAALATEIRRAARRPASPSSAPGAVPVGTTLRWAPVDPAPAGSVAARSQRLTATTR